VLARLACARAGAAACRDCDLIVSMDLRERLVSKEGAAALARSAVLARVPREGQPEMNAAYR